MKDTFINFSHLKLNEAPVPPREVEAAGSERAKAGSTAQREGTNKRREAQQLQMSTQTGQASKDMNTSTRVTEHLENINQEKEYLKKVQSLKSDWRTELSEELGEQQPEEPEHPYVKVMPNIHYKQIEAQKELAAAGKAEGTKKMVKEAKSTSSKMKDKDEISRRAAKLRQAVKASDKAGKEAAQHHDRALKARKAGKEKEAKGHQDKANKAANKARKSKAAAVNLDPVASKKYARKDKPSLTNKRYHKDLKTKTGRSEIVKRSMASHALDD